MSDAYVPCTKCDQECSLHVAEWIDGKPYHPWCLDAETRKPVETTLPACMAPDGADPCSAYKTLLDEHTKMRKALGEISLHGKLMTEKPPTKHWNVFDTWYNRGFEIARNIATHTIKGLRQ